MKRIYFFATPSDILPVLERFEQKSSLKYVETGILTHPDRAIYFRGSEIPDAGIATHETGSASKRYMVSLRDTKNQMFDFIDDTGNKRWILNNSDNEESVLLTMAGRWKDMLLPGLIDTVHGTAAAQSLMKRFFFALKAERYVKIENWWLGPEALQMLKTGQRLTTTAEQSPPEYDLKLPTPP